MSEQFLGIGVSQAILTFVLIEKRGAKVKIIDSSLMQRDLSDKDKKAENYVLALKYYIKKHELKDVPTAVCMPRHHFYFRTQKHTALPDKPLEHAELNELIKTQAKETIPFDIKESVTKIKSLAQESLPHPISFVINLKYKSLDIYKSWTEESGLMPFLF